MPDYELELKKYSEIPLIDKIFNFLVWAFIVISLLFIFSLFWLRYGYYSLIFAGIVVSLFLVWYNLDDRERKAYRIIFTDNSIEVYLGFFARHSYYNLGKKRITIPYDKILDFNVVPIYMFSKNVSSVSDIKDAHGIEINFTYPSGVRGKFLIKSGNFKNVGVVLKEVVKNHPEIPVKFIDKKYSLGYSSLFNSST